MSKTGQWAYDELKAWWDDGIASITASWNDYWDSVYKWFDDGVTGITTAWSDFWDSVYNWFDNGITGAVVTWTSFFTSIKDWFVTGITNAGVVWTNFWDMIKDAIWTAVTGLGGGNNNNNDNNNDNNNNNNSYDHMTGGRPTMHGGLIEEPIMGIGRSGRRYMFGEAGTEVVTPMNEISGSGSITINIQNMSGTQQDLNNLRQVILDVVQESSARRGRA